MIELEVDDSRRLTGPNLLSDHPGTVMEVFVQPEFHDQVIELWTKHLEQLFVKLDLSGEMYHRRFSNGLNLGFSADEDMLYAACEINEAAIELCRAEIDGDVADEELTSINRLQTFLNEERSPQLMSLIDAARTNNTTYLVDEDEFSLYENMPSGLGQWSATVL